VTKDSWLTCTVQDFIDKGEAEVKTGPFGTQLHASDYVETGTPVINARNIGFGEMRVEKLEFISDETVQRLSSHLLEPSDIVFGRKGTVERHVFIQPEQAKWFQGTDCLRLRFKSPSIEPRFVSYCLLTEEHKQWIMNQSSHGATMTSLNQAIIGRISLQLPPLPIQRRIASILSAYDDLIENNTRRIKILEQMAQAIYHEWFVEFRAPGVKLRKATSNEKKVTGQDQFPAGWELVKTADAVWVNPATKVPKDGEKPFIPMSSLPTDSMLINDIEYRTGNSGSKFRNGDTLFARITPCLENGKTAYVQFLSPDDAVAFGSTEFIVLRSKTVCPEFVYLMARSNEFRDNAIKSMSGATGRQRVQEACFDRFFFAHPDPTTIASFAELVSPMFRGIHVLGQKNANLRQTRDLLLPRLVGGEVDVIA